MAEVLPGILLVMLALAAPFVALGVVVLVAWAKRKG